MNRRSFLETLQSSHFTWLFLVLILALNFIVRWNLRTMPLERDEGEYAYAGQLLLQGVPPYQAAYNMKFPGTYAAYAAIMAVFGQTPAGIHVGLLVVTSLSIMLIFFIGRMLLDDFGGLMAAGIFGALSAMPAAFGLAGHATHFVVLFVCAGTFALLQAGKNNSRLWLFVSGAAFGIAILMKQHAATFCIAIAAWLFWQAWTSKKPWFPVLALFCGGIAAPLALTAVLLAACGVWAQFKLWTITYARDYVSLLPLQTAPKGFVENFAPLFSSAMWTWIAGAGALGLFFTNTPYRRAVSLGSGLFFAGLAAVIPGFYFRGHYFLMVMPGLALLVATLLTDLTARVKKFNQLPWFRFLPYALLFILVAEIFLCNGGEWFLFTPMELSRKIYGPNPFPEAAPVAAYLAAHSAPTDTLAIIGSEPELFFLAHRRSATGYIYIYPLTEDHPLAPRMRREFTDEIEAARPPFIVYVNLPTSWISVLTPGKTAAAFDEINHWWSSYAQNYSIVGEVDTHMDQPTEFFWDNNLAARTNNDRATLYILHRNETAAPKN